MPLLLNRDIHNDWTMTKTTGAPKACSRIAKTSSSSSSWGLSRRFGVRVLMHRDVITCRFFRSLPRSWLIKSWGRLGHESNEHLLASSSLSSSSPLSWSSSPFSLSSPHFSSCSSPVPSPFFRSPVSLSSFFPSTKRPGQRAGAVRHITVPGWLPRFSQRPRHDH